MSTSKHLLVLDIDSVLTYPPIRTSTELANYHNSYIVKYFYPDGNRYQVSQDLVDYLKVESNRRKVVLLSFWDLEEQGRLLDLLGLTNIDRLSVDRTVHNNDPHWFYYHKELPLYKNRIFQNAERVVWVESNIRQRSENLTNVTYVSSDIAYGITADQLKRTVKDAFQG